MSDEEIDDLLSRCVDELRQKQDILFAAYRIGSFDEFYLDQPAGTLSFRNAGGGDCVVCTITPIGSFCPGTRTWQWGWSNPNIPAPLRQRAEPLRSLAQQTGLQIFSERIVNADEQMAHDLTALSVAHLAARGFYRVPMSQVFTFFALDSVAQLT